MDGEERDQYEAVQPTTNSIQHPADSSSDLYRRIKEVSLNSDTGAVRSCHWGLDSGSLDVLRDFLASDLHFANNAKNNIQRSSGFVKILDPCGDHQYECGDSLSYRTKCAVKTRGERAMFFLTGTTLLPGNPPQHKRVVDHRRAQRRCVKGFYLLASYEKVEEEEGQAVEEDESDDLRNALIESRKPEARHDTLLSNCEISYRRSR